ncbi:hypothetical protein Tco_0519412 [Tanacetum coccineum]
MFVLDGVPYRIKTFASSTTKVESDTPQMVQIEILPIQCESEQLLMSVQVKRSNGNSIHSNAQSTKVFYLESSRFKDKTSANSDLMLSDNAIKLQDVADASLRIMGGFRVRDVDIYYADDCDAFYSDVDEAPTAHTMFMANLSSTDSVFDEARSSYHYVPDILFLVLVNDLYRLLFSDIM